MKLLINEPIPLIPNIHPEDWLEFVSMLSHFAIRTTPSENRLILSVQKITLDEIKINEFLSVLDSSEYVLSYGHLGGAGCELSLYMSKPF
jgi:hypothetical protein